MYSIRILRVDGMHGWMDAVIQMVKSSVADDWEQLEFRGET